MESISLEGVKVRAKRDVISLAHISLLLSFPLFEREWCRPPATRRPAVSTAGTAGPPCDGDTAAGSTSWSRARQARHHHRPGRWRGQHATLPLGARPEPPGNPVWASPGRLEVGWSRGASGRRGGLGGRRAAVRARRVALGERPSGPGRGAVEEAARQHLSGPVAWSLSLTEDRFELRSRADRCGRAVSMPCSRL